MAILKLATDMGVEFAFPSSTIMIEQFPEKKSLEFNYNNDKKRIEGVVGASLYGSGTILDAQYVTTIKNKFKLQMKAKLDKAMKDEAEKKKQLLV